MIPLYFLSEISKYWQICKKIFFEILVLTALTLGLILELTPKSALLSLTILYLVHKANYVDLFLKLAKFEGWNILKLRYKNGNITLLKTNFDDLQKLNPSIFLIPNQKFHKAHKSKLKHRPTFNSIFLECNCLI